MMSRDIAALHPKVAKMARAMIDECDRQGIDLLITCTHRTHLEQEELFAQGRTKPGKVVTNARGGESLHNYRLAFDVVPLRNGKPVWGTTGADGELWAAVGRIGEACGLEWAGRWKRFREFPHFQYTGGLKLADLKAGKTLEMTA